MTVDIDNSGNWVPRACTLPTEARPLRLAEFDALFAASLRTADRVSPTRLRLTFDGAAEVAATVADLTERESQCCSFFTFSTSTDADAMVLDVDVPVEHVAVLDGVAARAGCAR